MKFTRRSFLKGCCSTAAALTGGSITGLAFGGPPRGADPADLYINVFLRGGIDGLNLVVPYADSDYITARPSIRIDPPGQEDGALDLARGFGLHPSATALHRLYQAGGLAVVVASGSPDPSRSHFDAQDAMEKGTPGVKSHSSGWLARHLETAGTGGGTIPVLVTTSDVPTSLIGVDEVAALNSPGGLAYGGHWNEIDHQNLALRRMYNGSHWMQLAGSNAMDVIDRIAGAGSGAYTTPPFEGNPDPQPEVGYQGGFGNALRTIVQIQALELGLRVAAVDLGGWDTHENQAGQYANRVAELSQSLEAFYIDMLRFTDKFTLCVMSEFGRRVRENFSAGTDHGHGNVMLVLGPNVNKGVFGQWPGLQNDVLSEGEDVPVVNEYRQVLGEVLVRRLKNPNLPHIFPGGPAYNPLGVVKGSDLPIGSPVPSVRPVATVAGVALGIGAAMAWREGRIHPKESDLIHPPV